MTLEPPPNPSPWRAGRPVVAVGIVVLAALAVVTSASWLGRQVADRIQPDDTTTGTTVVAGQDVVVEIPRGSSASRIAEILQDTGVVRSATEFELAVRTAGLASSLKAGTYDLLTGMENDDVIDALRQGPLVRTFRVTVPEGLRVSEILATLAAASDRPVEEFEEALTDGSVVTGVTDLPETPLLSDWEGLLFPDTYEFNDGATAAEILRRLSDTMELRMGSVDWTGLEDAGFTRYQGVVIASLIEAEVRVAEERPIVSSVLRNRLDDGMLLQIDATVLYALDTREVEDFDPEVDSPFNTYRVTGLPPRPIAAPGLASLEAAAHPDETNFYFYVLSNQDGSHTFSRTLEEHQAAVAAARAAGVLP